MNREELPHNLYTSHEQLEANLAEYVEYFYGMRHQRFGMRTSSEAERNFANKKKSIPGSTQNALDNSNGGRNRTRICDLHDVNVAL